MAATVLDFSNLTSDKDYLCNSTDSVTVSAFYKVALPDPAATVPYPLMAGVADS